MSCLPDETLSLRPMVLLIPGVFLVSSPELTSRGALFQMVLEAIMLMRFPTWPNSSPLLKCMSLAMRLYIQCTFHPLGSRLGFPTCFANAIWQKQYIYLSAWLSPKPWVSLVSFLGDNMNHISNIFITYSSWNWFIFNCHLIFHYMDKPQTVIHFPIDGWRFLLIQKIMENIPIHASCIHGWNFLTCIYWQLMGYTYTLHIYWNIAKLLSKDFEPIYNTFPPAMYENFHFSIVAIT